MTDSVKDIRRLIRDAGNQEDLVVAEKLIKEAKKQIKALPGDTTQAAKTLKIDLKKIIEQFWDPSDKASENL